MMWDVYCEVFVWLHQAEARLSVVWGKSHVQVDGKANDRYLPRDHNAYLEYGNQVNLATSSRRTPVKCTLSSQGIEKIQKNAVKVAHVLRQVTEKPHSNVGPDSKVFTRDKWLHWFTLPAGVRLRRM